MASTAAQRSGLSSTLVNVQPPGAAPPTTGNTPVVPSTPMVQTDRIETGLPSDVRLPTLQNIVATVDLGYRLDLKTIALTARNTEYNPKRFAAVIMRIREPRTTALIFASGKLVCTGAKTESDCLQATKLYARIVKKVGFQVKFKNFQIQNIVASTGVNFPIRLEALAHKHSQFATYEPELFPGLIYRNMDPPVVLLIFVSGKIVLTGAKERDHIHKAFEKIYPVLELFKKDEG